MYKYIYQNVWIYISTNLNTYINKIWIHALKNVNIFINMYEYIAVDPTTFPSCCTLVCVRACARERETVPQAQYLICDLCWQRQRKGKGTEVTELEVKRKKELKCHPGKGFSGAARSSCAHRLGCWDSGCPLVIKTLLWQQYVAACCSVLQCVARVARLLRVWTTP